MVTVLRVYTLYLHPRYIKSPAMRVGNKDYTIVRMWLKQSFIHHVLYNNVDKIREVF